MIIATLNPNFIVDIVSEMSHWSGEQQRMRVVALCSRRACCKILVSFESLKGTCLAPHERFLMTSAHRRILFKEEEEKHVVYLESEAPLVHTALCEEAGCALSYDPAISFRVFEICISGFSVHERERDT